MRLSTLELARRLVAFNTISVGNQSGTADIADFVSEYCREVVGCEVDRFFYVNGGIQKVNVVAYKGGRDSYLALAGHMDTVSVVTRRWATDPFELTLRDGRYHGLGIADMKLFLATAIKAVEAIPVAELKRPVALYFTCDEEVGCVGARKLVASKPKFCLAPNIVVGEPTTMELIASHKGYLYFRVEVFRAARNNEGPSAKGRRTVHSSDDRTTTNVVEVAMPGIIAALSSFRANMKKHSRDDRFDPPYPTMNIGGKIVMPTDAAKNVIAGSFTLENDLRLLPGQDPEVLLHVLQIELSRAAAQMNSTAHGEEIQVKVSRVRPPSLPMSTSTDSRIVRGVLSLCPGKTSKNVSFNTEGGLYNREGAESVIWGPGSIAQAHHDNEYVDEAWLAPGIAAQYSALIRQMCCKE